ncbi:MAG TPA: transposase, partial [Gemmatimonadaceae bacterium]|nr:transposase [Gemmatimonadaceae bacterium]
EKVFLTIRRRMLERPVIYKARATRIDDRSPRDNCRYVVTNLRTRPQSVYGLYAKRGEIENRIKELQHGMRIDRTSCTSFMDNQMRALLIAAAYAVVNALKLTDRLGRDENGGNDAVGGILPFERRIGNIARVPMTSGNARVQEISLARSATPGDRDSLASQVRSVASSASARATYAAS